MAKRGSQDYSYGSVWHRARYPEKYRRTIKKPAVISLDFESVEKDVIELTLTLREAAVLFGHLTRHIGGELGSIHDALLRMYIGDDLNGAGLPETNAGISITGCHIELVNRGIEFGDAR